MPLYFNVARREEPINNIGKPYSFPQVGLLDCQLQKSYYMINRQPFQIAKV